MCKLVDIKALSNYKLWLRFLPRGTGSDGVEGEVDLSELAGKGVFELWNDYENFEKAYIEKNGQVVWSDEIDMCSDSLYAFDWKDPGRSISKTSIDEILETWSRAATFKPLNKIDPLP